jgi:phosphodiesterase/alkaline phosphatase D-like protein
MAKTYSFTDFTTPSNEAAVAVAGGTLTASTTYYYRLIGVVYAAASSYNWRGKTKASAEFTATTDNTNKSIELSFDMPLGEMGAYRI